MNISTFLPTISSFIWMLAAGNTWEGQKWDFGEWEGHVYPQWKLHPCTTATRLNPLWICYDRYLQWVIKYALLRTTKKKIWCSYRKQLLYAFFRLVMKLELVAKPPILEIPNAYCKTLFPVGILKGYFCSVTYCKWEVD